ncbi:MAG: DapH/DapD/GlmU-related protein [Solirubrobacteraceae bacterium]
MAGQILRTVRTLHVRLWTLELRARLRRQGVRLELHVGAGVRFAGRPRLDLDLHDAGSSGSLVVRIGAHARIGRDLVLDVRPGGENVVEVGEGCLLGDHVRLQLRGGAIRLGPDVNVRDFCELKSAGELTVGAGVVCARNVTLHCVERVTLGARAAVAERVTITDSDHGADGSDMWVLAQPLRVDPVEVGDNVLIATNAVVLRGARLGANAVVAAGAVVTAGEIPAGWLLAGVPAKAVKALGAPEPPAP